MATRQCKVCQQEFVKQQPLQVVCSLKCAIEYTKRQNAKKAEKDLAQRRKAERERAKMKRRELETVPELIKKAQAVFNRFIRLRDKGKPCISCGKPLGFAPNSYDAGHYRSVGSASHLRFDEANAHGQCKHCNNYLSGNVVNYRKGLIERVGLAEVERLENDNAPRKWDKEGLRELAETYQVKLKALED
ncbi:recombination protein NinG [Kingella negevensis]|uniref:recombination protein NinG n=1 Tax=Kingella negevensis TaxID=1522312 RepID=UPI00050A0EE9|nr:recombination protein NinG [Kingella negevensis]